MPLVQLVVLIVVGVLLGLVNRYVGKLSWLSANGA
jgi:hypothetical protein